MKTLKTNLFLRLFSLILLLGCSLTACQEQYQPSPLPEAAPGLEDGVGEVQVENVHFLREQERLGGHTIERHVGKSLDYLRNRLRYSSIRAASTYYEANQAGQVIVNALNANSGRVNSWLSGGGSRLTLSYQHRRYLGIVLERGKTTPRNSSLIRIVLQKKSSAPNGYFVLTSYPN